MKAFLKSPGKFHIVQLPDEKSFVVKVTDAEMPIFLTMCQQLRGVLGQCDAIPATPVDAHVATNQEIAESSAASTKRIREARQRQDVASADVAAEERELKAARDRHPAGKRRAGGRHAKPETETTFDQLMATADADDEAAKKQIARMEIAAAQDRVARVQDEMEKANEALRQAFERGGEIHNRAVIEKFAQQAGDAIAEKLADDEKEPPTEHVYRDTEEEIRALEDAMKLSVSIGDYTRAGELRSKIFALRGGITVSDEALKSPEIECGRCGHKQTAINTLDLLQAHAEHIAEHKRQDEAADASP